MSKQRFQTLFTVLMATLFLWLTGKYLLPLLLPFALGTLLALASEPAVRFLRRLLPERRTAAVFLGVTATLVLLTLVFFFLVRLLIREMSHLTQVLPDLEQSARQGLISLENWLLKLTLAAPESLRPLLTRGVLDLFHNGSDLYDRALAHLPQIATGVLSHVPDSFLFFGTGLLSSYLISARLPRFRTWLGRILPPDWQTRWLPALRTLKASLWGWLQAQAKLMALTFLTVCAGLLLLAVEHAPVWALLIAGVDAVPMLGTGLILIPWSLILFLRGNGFRALGMLGIFALASALRTILEPRLLGRQLGLDPLVTLLAMYLGYRLFGFPGLLISPALAVTVVQILKTAPAEQQP